MLTFELQFWKAPSPLHMWIEVDDVECELEEEGEFEKEERNQFVRHLT